MENNLRMDLRRLWRGKLLVTALAILLGITLALYGMFVFITGDGILWFWGNIMHEPVTAAEITDTYAMRNTTILQTFLGEIPIYWIIAYTALTFTAQDFRSGYCKNLFTRAGSRRDYIVGRMVSLLLVSVALVVSVYLLSAALGVCGVFAGGPGGTLADWLGSAVHQIAGCWAYAMFAQFVAVLLWRNGFGAVTLFLFVVGIPQTVIFLAVELLHLTAVSEFMNYLIGPMAEYQPLLVSTHGLGYLAQAVLLLVVWGFVYAALSGLVLKRRDLA